MNSESSGMLTLTAVNVIGCPAATFVATVMTSLTFSAVLNTPAVVASRSVYFRSVAASIGTSGVTCTTLV
jgi:hypothetical protein